MSQIHQALAGKRVRAVMTDGQKLLVQTFDGHEVTIIWTDNGPELQSINVKISLPGIDIDSVVANIGGN